MSFWYLSLSVGLEFPCLTLAHKRDAVVVLHTHYKGNLQCGQGHVCSHYTANVVACLPDQPPLWLGWSGLNASSMCLDPFTPVFTAVHLRSDYLRRIFLAKCEVGPIHDVIMLVSLCWVSGCGPARHSHKWEGPSRGENEGSGRERLWVGWG